MTFFLDERLQMLFTCLFASASVEMPAMLVRRGGLFYGMVWLVSRRSGPSMYLPFAEDMTMKDSISS